MYTLIIPRAARIQMQKQHSFFILYLNGLNPVIDRANVRHRQTMKRLKGQLSKAHIHFPGMKV